MKVKHVLVDADGVAIKAHPYFSDRYSKEFDVEKEKIMEFFKREYPFCARGKADVREELVKYLDLWNWEGSVDDLLVYWFEGENEVDERVMKVVDSLRDLGVECHLASDQEKVRGEYLLEDVGLAKRFDESFFSCDLGVVKDEREFFEKVVEALGVEPS